MYMYKYMYVFVKCTCTCTSTYVLYVQCVLNVHVQEVYQGFPQKIKVARKCVCGMRQLVVAKGIV